MKTKADKSAGCVKATKSVTASLVEAKLKGKILFADKIEAITEFINNVKVSAL